MAEKYVDGLRGRGAFESGPGTKPNMLCVSFDMVPREFYLPREGDLAPRTPNLDALRADGLFFSNAYCASPLCAPSRAALFTGRYSYITSNSERAHDGQQTHLRDDETIYPEYLKAAGYRTRHFGKCHVGAAKFLAAFGENDQPWDRWSPPWYDDDGYRAFLAAKGVEGFRFSRVLRGLPPSGAGEGNFLGGWVEAGNGAPFPADASYPAYTTGLALEALAARRGEDRPFYFQLDYFEPHQPFFIPAGFEERERELRAAVRLPASWEAAREGKGDLGARLPGVYARYRKYWGLTDPQTAADYLVAHVLQYEILDAEFGRLKAALEAEGLYDSCLVLATSDHGEMNCRSGLVDKGAYLNPRVVQVPLYLKPPAGFPGAPAPGTRIDRPVSLLDAAPTILAAAGVSARARFDGAPLLGPGAPGPGEARPPILAEVFSHVVPNPAACLVEEKAGETLFYTVNFADEADELYVRRGGVWDERSSAGDPERRADLEALRRRMLAVFEADERWVSYAAFLRLLHAESFADGSDLQKFVNS